MVKRVHVAVGVIVCNNEILIAKRADHQHQGGFWEFPGGKVEKNETVRDALIRELKEELTITVLSTTPLTEVIHDYTDKQVRLDVWWVDQFSGNPEGAEGQPLMWVRKENLREYAFPEANNDIVEAILNSENA